MDSLSRDSGIFGAKQPQRANLDASPAADGGRSGRDPVTFVLAGAWALSLLQVGVGLVRGGGFGPDRIIALAFAVGLPLAAREQLGELGRRAARRFRGGEARER